jgi:RNA polymerase sigma-70 factor (ECF subfamily)
MPGPAPDPAQDLDATVAAARTGDEEAFGRLVERFTPELQVHCYRMLGSLDDAEDTVQDVFLQAWRALPRFEGRASIRTWLYRIATNACLARRRRDDRRGRLLAASTVADGTAADGTAAGVGGTAATLPLAMSVPWLQPCPDDLLDRAVARDPDPASALASRETVEIAFVAALQHLPDRQRAVLVLRDVVGWPVERCAEALDATVASVNSALQRARSTLRDRLGAPRDEWPAATGTAAERDLVRRYADALERSDDAALADLLAEDVVVGHQPWAGGNMTDEPAVYGGREFVVEAWAPVLHDPQPLDLRAVPVRANRSPAVATYVRQPGTAEHRAFSLTVLRLDGDGRVAEVANFLPDRFPAFGLPETFTGGDGEPVGR